VKAEVDDQDTAVRVLVQMLLPGLKALCARTWWMPHHPDGGSLWLVADQEECAAVALELLIAAIRGYRWRSRRGPANLNLLGGTRTRLTRLVSQAWHYAFGVGIHRCPGSNLARLVLRLTLEAVLDRLGDLRLAPGAEPTYRVGNTRGLERLDVTFSAHAVA
jgi:hypothetical protein